MAAIDTTSTSTVTTTSTAGSSSTTTPAHVVTTVEEAEAILAELWFGWFEGIYNEDEARIREVVGSEGALEDALQQFGVMEFSAAPQRDQVNLSETEVLRSDEMCLAIWTTIDVSGFREGSSTAVHILRWSGDRWVTVGLWEFKDDLWQADCESQLESLPS
jgi:hypothetical protein